MDQVEHFLEDGSVQDIKVPIKEILPKIVEVAFGGRELNRILGTKPLDVNKKKRS